MNAEIIGNLSIPTIIVVCAFLLLFSKNNLADAFLDGAKEGLQTSFKLLPTLVMLLCAVRMFFVSGGVQIITNLLSKPLMLLGITPELSSVLLVRPFSGSAATAVADTIFKTYGPDSIIGLCASVIMGSSDTIIYTLSMYFSAVQIKKTRYAIPASFIILLFCSVLGCYITKKLLC